LSKSRLKSSKKCRVGQNQHGTFLRANVAGEAFAVGFKDPSYFSKIFQEEFGVVPSATRK
jgi:AraC-like DNA-binding protein